MRLLADKQHGGKLSLKMSDASKQWLILLWVNKDGGSNNANVIIPYEILAVVLDFGNLETRLCSLMAY